MSATPAVAAARPVGGGLVADDGVDAYAARERPSGHLDQQRARSIHVRLAALGYRVDTLARLHDVDEPADLNHVPPAWLAPAAPDSGPS